MKPNRHLSHKITAAVAASILSIALTGTACGTFAWFMYGARTKITEYEGTSIGVNNLEIGIFSEVDLPEAQEHGLKLDENDSTLYWFEGHEIPASSINYVLSANEYATNSLFPVTSRKYSQGDEFQLFSTPDLKNDTDEYASKNGRIYLPLVFRTLDIIDEEYVSGENIFLTHAEIDPLSSGSEIHRAIRIYTDNRDGNTHLINWSESEDGSTDVGGVLNLDADGYFDYGINEEDGNSYEVIYGQVKESNYKPAPEMDDSEIFIDTFHAGHKAGVVALESCIPEVAEYEGNYGFRNMRKWVTTTNSLTNNYAYLNLSIFIEGWDKHVIDPEINALFNINLTFETEL